MTAEVVVEQDIVGFVADHGGDGRLALFVKDKTFKHGY
jgi:hypothetical protein